ncbi:substrate-binding domain-containing protein [Streptomyces sp. NPDC007088]|uniref:substrate-binding domain-containing protein n=1 Tax=Streptomyces sp. NPDC007088 TaxID=3364773 RepID=UPI00368DDB71
MEWLSAENVVAVLTAVLGVIASVVLLWYERRVPRRRHIGYRVQVDMPIRARDAGREQGRVPATLGLFDGFGDDAPAGPGTSLVLLRVENDGSQSIDASHYTGHELHGLTAEFTGRTVRGLDVTQRPGSEHLLAHFAPSGGLSYSGSVLDIPRVPLNRGEYYKLLVLLDGGEVGGEVKVSGGLLEGRVTPNRALSPDETPPLLSRAARISLAVLTAFVLTLATLILLPGDVPPRGCATGTLTLTGSTAFRPVAGELGQKYEAECPGSRIRVETRGSTEGIKRLTETGSATKSGSPATIAFSDGAKPAGYPRLQGHRVAVSVFSLVVNDSVPLKDLSSERIKALYFGRATNWKQADGPDLPVVLVSRDASSGTRKVLQERVLHGREKAVSASVCGVKDNPNVKINRCEEEDTRHVLDVVARTEGALGYADLGTDQHLPAGLHPLSIDGHRPSADDLTASRYPFREIEYAYTYGNPPSSSLVSDFLTFMIHGAGQEIVRTRGHLPCYTPEGLKLCGG